MSTSSIRWVAAVPSLAGGLEIYRGESGIPIEFTAPDREAALRMAAKANLPPIVSILSRLEFETPRPARERPGCRRQHRVCQRRGGRHRR